MTTEELIDWLVEQKDESARDRDAADINKDGNALWYFTGRNEAFWDVLEKLDNQ